MLAHVLIVHMEVLLQRLGEGRRPQDVGIVEPLAQAALRRNSLCSIFLRGECFRFPTRLAHIVTWKQAC